MTRPLMTFEEVRAALKQRFPMLMIDTVTALEPGKSIRATKNVTGNELQFLGHFPEHAVMPGTLIIEAIGQAASILFTKSTGTGVGAGAGCVGTGLALRTGLPAGCWARPVTTRARNAIEEKSVPRRSFIFLPIVSEFSCGAPECDSLEAKALPVKLPSLWADSSWVMLVAGSQIPGRFSRLFPGYSQEGLSTDCMPPNNSSFTDSTPVRRCKSRAAATKVPHPAQWGQRETVYPFRETLFHRSAPGDST